MNKQIATVSRAELPAIGTFWAEQGGVFAGVLRADVLADDGRTAILSGPDYALIIPTDPAADPAADLGDVRWGKYGEIIPGAFHINNGAANTAAMAAAGNELAQRIQALTIGDHSDFYLPARGEGALAFFNCRDLFDKRYWHWLSTQYSANGAWGQLFDDGYQNDYYKESGGRARVVRRSIIQ